MRYTLYSNKVVMYTTAVLVVIITETQGEAKVKGATQHAAGISSASNLYSYVAS